jgi:hypothetical protein
MGQKIFKGQTALTLELDTKIDLTSATNVWMKYTKPNGTTSSWVASVQDPATSGIIEYVITSPNDLNEVGEWTRWAYIEIDNIKYAPGDSVTFEVYEEGQ